MKTTYSIIYRTGGYARFQWNRVFDTYATHAEAAEKAADIERGGYKTLIHKTADLDSIGLPETWE